KGAEHDGGNGVRVPQKGDEDGAEEIDSGKHAIDSEAIDQPAEQERANDAACLNKRGGDTRKREADASVMNNGGQPVGEEEEIEQAGEEDNPHKYGRKGAAVA